MMTIGRLTAGIVIAAAAIACQAIPAPEAAGQPPQGFPDLSGFRAVDPAPFRHQSRGGLYSSFVTADGLISCTMASGSSSGCRGDLPGAPRSEGGNGAGCTVVSGWDQYSFSSTTVQCPPYADEKLNKNEKLIDGDMVCAVGGDRLVACINTRGNHGFVLRPEGSWTF